MFTLPDRMCSPASRLNQRQPVTDEAEKATSKLAQGRTRIKIASGEDAFINQGN
jgi:hypothetical protein